MISFKKHDGFYDMNIEKTDEQTSALIFCGGGGGKNFWIKIHATHDSFLRFKKPEAFYIIEKTHEQTSTAKFLWGRGSKNCGTQKRAWENNLRCCPKKLWGWRPAWEGHEKRLFFIFSGNSSSTYFSLPSTGLTLDKKCGVAIFKIEFLTSQRTYYYYENAVERWRKDWKNRNLNKNFWNWSQFWDLKKKTNWSKVFAHF